MFRARPSLRSALLPGLLALVLIPGAAAQGGDFFARLKAFQKGMESRSADARLSAIEAFQNCGDPSAVKALVNAVADNEDDLKKVRSRFAKAGRTYHDAQAKITNVRMTQAAYNAAMAKIRPLKAEYDRLNERIRGLEKVTDALLRGVEAIVKSVPSDQRPRALQEVVKTYEWASKPPEKALALKAMSRIDDPLIMTTLIGAARLGRNPGIRVAAFEAMRTHPKQEMVAVAIEALTDKYWQVRVAALDIVRLVGGAESVEPLITALDHARGRMIDELVETLKAVTKVNHHDNVTLRRDWWSRSKDRFRGRGEAAGVPDEVAKGEQDKPKGGDGGTYFYGIRTRSQHIIYVIDISGSMAWTLESRYSGGQRQPSPAPAGKSKLDNAVKELTASIMQLKDGGTFNMVTYAIEHDVWKKKMQKATKSSKAAGRKWAKGLRPEGATNVFDALERAFGIAGRGSFDKGYGIAADTIFFLSDGQPNRGRVIEPNAILREVKKLNDLRRIKIHCIGLGTSTDQRFMRQLAKENGGQYVHIGPGR